MLFVSNTHGPGDEHFMINMRDLILRTAPANVFGSLVALLDPYTGRWNLKVTTPMATLRDVEGWRQDKLGLRQEVQNRSMGGQTRRPQRVMHMHM